MLSINEGHRQYGDADGKEQTEDDDQNELHITAYCSLAGLLSHIFVAENSLKHRMLPVCYPKTTKCYPFATKKPPNVTKRQVEGCWRTVLG